MSVSVTLKGGDRVEWCVFVCTVLQFVCVVFEANCFEIEATYIYFRFVPGYCQISQQKRDNK